MIGLTPLQNDLLKRLRSGSYIQLKGALHGDLEGCSFCCLGVACDILADNGLGSWVKDPDHAYSRFYVTGYDPSFFLNHDTGYHFALSKTSAAQIPLDLEGYFGFKNLQAALSYLNDKGLPFRELAALLEDFFLTGDPDEIIARHGSLTDFSLKKLKAASSC